MNASQDDKTLCIRLELVDHSGADVCEFLDEYGDDTDYRDELEIEEIGDDEYRCPSVYTFRSFPLSRVPFKDALELEKVYSRMISCKFVKRPGSEDGDCCLEITYQ